jgi:hypothetical protein
MGESDSSERRPELSAQWLSLSMSVRYDSASEIQRLQNLAIVIALAMSGEVRLGHGGSHLFANTVSAASLLLALFLTTRVWRDALAPLLLITSSRVVYALPYTANHHFLAATLSFIVLLGVRADGNSASLAARAIRVQFCAVMFWAGIQKLTHGFYDRGELLGFLVAQRDARFSWFLKLVLPLGESTQLETLGSSGSPGGSYQLKSFRGLLLSNLVPVSELCISLLLSFKRTVLAGLLLATATLVGIELMAREVAFGLICFGMMAFFARAQASQAYTRACWLLTALKVLANHTIPGFRLL